MPKLKIVVSFRRYRFGYLALALGILGLILALRFSAPSVSAEQPSPRAGREIELAAADIESVRVAKIDRALFLSGTLQPLRQSTLVAEVEGRVLAVEVRAGDRVAAGQILARLDARDLESRLAEQRARFASSQAQFELAEKNQRRDEQLVAREFLSPAGLDNSRSNLDSNRENLRAQQALVALAQQAVDKAVVRAPLAGIVAERAVEPGQAVAPGARLFSVVDLSALELAANVPVSEVGSVRPGQTIRLQATGVPTSIVGTVERIAPVADPATRMIPVYVRVPNPRSELKGGMLVQGQLSIGGAKPELAVSHEAIRRQGEQTFVLRIKDGAVEQVPIETGRSNESTGQVEVRQGLAGGDKVIVAKVQQLAPGQRVVVRP